LIRLRSRRSIIGDGTAIIDIIATGDIDTVTTIRDIAGALTITTGSVSGAMRIPIPITVIGATITDARL
jgi:hypothetical protein